MPKTFRAKVLINKKNNQFSINLPKLKIKDLKDKIPKEIDLEIKKIKW